MNKYKIVKFKWRPIDFIIVGFLLGLFSGIAMIVGRNCPDLFMGGAIILYYYAGFLSGLGGMVFFVGIFTYCYDEDEETTNPNIWEDVYLNTSIPYLSGRDLDEAERRRRDAAIRLALSNDDPNAKEYLRKQASFDYVKKL